MGDKTLASSVPQTETFSQKVRADAQFWADIWRKKLTIAVYLRLFLLEPGFQLAFSLRLQGALTHFPVIGKGLRRVVWYFTTVQTGCHIDPSTAEHIGGGLYLPHPTGIVIGGDGIRIGRKVSILQQVTLGRTRSSADTKKSVMSTVTICDGAAISCGAKILGAVTVGEGATIGANAVVLRDVPPNCSAVGVPARILYPRPADEGVSEKAEAS